MDCCCCHCWWWLVCHFVIIIHEEVQSKFKITKSCLKPATPRTKNLLVVPPSSLHLSTSLSISSLIVRCSKWQTIIINCIDVDETLCASSCLIVPPVTTAHEEVISMMGRPPVWSRATKWVFHFDSIVWVKIMMLRTQCPMSTALKSD